MRLLSQLEPKFVYCVSASGREKHELSIYLSVYLPDMSVQCLASGARRGNDIWPCLW